MEPDNRTKAILAAVRSGVTYAHIAEIYGISRQRVGQIARAGGWEPTRPASRRGQGKHGTYYGYRYLRCRCDECRLAERLRKAPK